MKVELRHAAGPVITFRCSVEACELLVNRPQLVPGAALGREARRCRLKQPSWLVNISEHHPAIASLEDRRQHVAVKDVPVLDRRDCRAAAVSDDDDTAFLKRPNHLSSHTTAHVEFFGKIHLAGQQFPHGKPSANEFVEQQPELFPMEPRHAPTICHVGERQVVPMGPRGACLARKAPSTSPCRDTSG